jgi:hypothetical protein
MLSSAEISLELEAKSPSKDGSIASWVLRSLWNRGCSPSTLEYYWQVIVVLGIH